MSRFFASGFLAISLAFVACQAAKASSYVVTYRGVVSDNVDPLSVQDAGFGLPTEPDTQWPTANSDFFDAFGLANTNLVGLPFSVSFTVDPSQGYVYSHATYTEYYSTDLTYEGYPPTEGSAGMPVTAVTVNLGLSALTVDVPAINSHYDDGFSDIYSLDTRYISHISAFSYGSINYADINSSLDTRYVYNVRTASNVLYLAGGVYSQLYTHDEIANISPSRSLNYTLGPDDYGSIAFWLYGNPYELIYGRMTSVTIDGTSGVPETGTWGMMLLGCTTIGWAMRQSRKLAILA